MHSIGHFIIDQNPDTKVLYVTSEEFTNEVIESIRNGNSSAMTKFRDKYRTVDVLMIDDIQFIAGKDSTMEERIREKWSKQLAAVDKNSNYAGVLCVDSRVLLFDHGRMNLCGFFKRFGRTGWKVWKDQCMVGEVEAGTAILLTDHGFLNYCEEELAGCLRPESVGTDLLSDRAERAERRLAELGRKAEQRGGRHMGAVWILPVKGEAIWSKGKQSNETVQTE